MPRGSKAAYTNKQRRQAQHIEEGYEERGVSAKEAARRAWATVNKESGGGKKSGSGVGRATSKASSRKGGRIGGKHAAGKHAAEERSGPPKRIRAAGKRTRSRTTKSTSRSR